MWKLSDGRAVLEMLFDDLNNPEPGILLTYRPEALPGCSIRRWCLIGETTVVESLLSGIASNRKQTYSWGTAVWNTLEQVPGTGYFTSSDAGRVVLEEKQIELAGGGFSPGLSVRVALRAPSPGYSCGAGQTYLALAFHQRMDGSQEVTARTGIALAGLSQAVAGGGLFCGGDTLKFGIFNTTGFVQDNLTVVPGQFPKSTDVAALFGTINTTGSGADGPEDLTEAKLISLTVVPVLGDSVSVSKIGFHPYAEGPSF